MSRDLAGPASDRTTDPAVAQRRPAWPLVLGGGLVLATIAVLDLAPLAALIACGIAAGRGYRGTRRVWLSLCIGAAAVLLAWIAAIAADFGLLDQGSGSLTLVAPILLHLALATGATLALRRRLDHRRDVDIVLDAGLSLTLAVLLLARFHPTALRVAAEGEGVLPWIGLGTTLAALGSLFCATLLVLRPSYRLPGSLPPLLLGATISFLIGSVGTIEVASTVGWLILTVAGVCAVRPVQLPGLVVRSAPVRRVVHEVLIPATALVLGAVMVDIVRSGGATLEYGLAGAFLALLLAFRIRRTVRSDEHHAETQRLLAQNYALVEVSRALADAMDLNRTLNLVATWACKLLDSPAAGVELLDAEQNELEVRAVHGLPSHLLGLRTPVEGTLTGSVVRTGRAVAVSDLWSSSFRLYDRVDAFGAFPTAAAPLHYREERLGALFAIRFDRTFDDADLELLGALADQASLAIRNAQLFEQVRALSLTDPLTGLANRRQLARDLAREFAATRRGRQLIAVVFDLDNFKDYNDEFGHPAGDEVLRLFGQALAFETRAMNLAARYGGDEFVALLSDTSPDGARVFIDRVASRFQEAMDQLGRGTITISAGLAECEPGMKTPDELIAAADRALYRVKPGKGARG